MDKYLNTTATTIIITTSDNKVLLQQRDNNPNIEFPGCLSLISGYVDADETPLDGIIRELKEEIIHKSKEQVNFSAITYLGSVQRYDYDRFDFVHHTYLLDDASEISTMEGTGLRFIDYNECLTLNNLAPHHKYFLQRYQNTISNIINTQAKSRFDEININDLIRVSDMGNTKDLDLLEHGNGFVVGDDTNVSGLIHFEEDIKFIGYLQFIPNNPRGNHYHLRKVEYMLILKGVLHSKVTKYDKIEESVEIVWRKGQLMRLLPGCIHTLTALGDSNVIAIEFSPQRYLSSDVLKK